VTAVKTASHRLAGGGHPDGGGIKPPAKIVDVKPIYPAVAEQARVQGVVICEVLIGPDGKVADVRILRSIPLLDQAAVDAVRQWAFTPTLPNGSAVPVIMTVGELHAGVAVSWQLSAGSGSRTRRPGSGTGIWPLPAARPLAPHSARSPPRTIARSFPVLAPS
jgi:protein TonB